MRRFISLGETKDDDMVPLIDDEVATFLKMLEDLTAHLRNAATAGDITTLAGATDNLNAYRPHGCLAAYDLLKQRLLNRVSSSRTATVGGAHRGSGPSAEPIVSRLIQLCVEYRVHYEHCVDRTINYVKPFLRNCRVLLFGDGEILTQVAVDCLLESTGARFVVPEGTPNGLSRLLTNVRQCDRIRQRLRDDPTFEAVLRRSLTTVPDCAVAQVMSDMDFVLVGANAITEHGGIVHYTGTYQIALLAQAMRLPFYVVAPTYKFARMFPLTTKDLRCNQDFTSLLHAAPQSLESLSDYAEAPPVADDASANSGLFSPVELVPPGYVTQVFTEEGIMPPTSVADYIFKVCTVPDSI